MCVFFYLAALDSAVNYIAHLLADGADEFWFSLRTTIVGLGTRKDLRKDVVMIAASARPRFYTSTHPIRWLWQTSLCFHWDGSADVSLPWLGITVGCDFHFNGLGCPQKVWKWSEKKIRFAYSSCICFSKMWVIWGSVLDRTNK